MWHFVGHLSDCRQRSWLAFFFGCENINFWSEIMSEAPLSSKRITVLQVWTFSFCLVGINYLCRREKKKVTWGSIRGHLRVTWGSPDDYLKEKANKKNNWTHFSLVSVYADQRIPIYNGSYETASPACCLQCLLSEWSLEERHAGTFFLVGLHLPRLLGSLTTQPVGVVLAALINAYVPRNHITCPRLAPHISDSYTCPWSKLKQHTVEYWSAVQWQNDILWHSCNGWDVRLVDGIADPETIE